MWVILKSKNDIRKKCLKGPLVTNGLSWKLIPQANHPLFLWQLFLLNLLYSIEEIQMNQLPPQALLVFRTEEASAKRE